MSAIGLKLLPRGIGIVVESIIVVVSVEEVGLVVVVVRLNNKSSFSPEFDSSCGLSVENPCGGNHI
jgi:hypothetical protein